MYIPENDELPKEEMLMDIDAITPLSISIEDAKEDVLAELEQKK